MTQPIPGVPISPGHFSFCFEKAANAPGGAQKYGANAPLRENTKIAFPVNIIFMGNL